MVLNYQKIPVDASHKSIISLSFHLDDVCRKGKEGKGKGRKRKIKYSRQVKGVVNGC